MITHKKTYETTTGNNEIDTKLSLIKYTSQVQNRLKTDINSDFVLAKLADHDKELIIELTSNAYFAKKVCQSIKQKINYQTWNPNRKKWETHTTNTKASQYIDQTSQQIFDAFMTRIYINNITNLMKNLDNDRS